MSKGKPSAMQKRPRGPETPLRILLGKSLHLLCANSPRKANLGRRIQRKLGDDAQAPPQQPQGTPPTWQAAGTMKPPFSTLSAAAKYEALASFKGKHVPDTPAKAFTLLHPKFQGGFETKKNVTNLVFDLLKVVYQGNLMPEYSAFCVTGACVLAAQTALHTAVLSCDALAPLTRAVGVTYAVLGARTSRNLRVVRAVIDAEGDPYRFPSKSSCAEKGSCVPVGSRLTMLRDRVSARGASRLSALVNSDELPEPDSPVSSCDNYHALLEADEMDYEPTGEEGVARKIS